LTKKTTIQGAISWQMAVNAGTPIETLLNEDETALYVETLTPSTSSTGEPYDLIRINDLDVGSPWLADTVDESYQALRQRVHSEVGYDFLGELSDAHRGADFFSDASQYSSWHKSGRAIDTLFELTGNRMEIVRQNMDGETYWRILLWCEDQSGRCGQPMTVNPWDYSYEARNLIAPEQGGIEKANQYGYYLDFTTLADIYGWERIASYDDEDFSWTWHFKAFEYWHYQKRLEAHIGSGNWYQAMKDVYAPSIIDEYFTWENMREADEDPYVIVLKGVPVPPIVTRWWQTLLP
jgi:TolB protein